MESIPGLLKRYQIRALGFLKVEITVSDITLSPAYYIHVKYNISTLLPPSIIKLVHTMEDDRLLHSQRFTLKTLAVKA